MAESLSNGVSTESLDKDTDDGFKFSSEMSLEEVRSRQHKFCEDRDWHKYHSPRSVLLALVGEVGELASLFQWRNESQPGSSQLSANEKVRVGEEMSDVLIYLVDLAEQCQIDLPAAVIDKLAKNAQKYPIDRVKGSAKKYNDYPQYKERQEGDGSE